MTAALLAPGESVLRDRISTYVLPGLLRMEDGALAALLRALLPASDAAPTYEQVCEGPFRAGAAPNPCLQTMPARTLLSARAALAAQHCIVEIHTMPHVAVEQELHRRSSLRFNPLQPLQGWN